MRFSVRLNNDLSVRRTVELARTAEAAGFDQFWLSNDLFLRSAPVMLAVAARETERIALGTGILNPTTLDPSEIAMAAATLDELSDGRFRLGIAAGAGDFLSWIGRPQSSPLAAVSDTVTVLRSLFAGERAEHHGRFLDWSEECWLRFETRRDIPIYVGAMGPRMLELAGRIADGVLPLLFPPEHWTTVAPLLSRGEAERTGELAERELDRAACVWVSLDEDGDRARRALAEKIAYYGHALSPLILERIGLERSDFEPLRRRVQVEGDLDGACELVTGEMLRIGVVGTAREVIERLEPLVADGARHLSFGPPLGPDPRAAIELLGRSVLPHFRRG